MENNEQHSAVHTVWVGEQDRIVSFHPIEGYILRTFYDRDFFISFLQSLQVNGYRFQ